MRIFVFKILLFTIAIFFSQNTWSKDDAEPEIYLNVYVRSDCPHCRNAKDFLPGFISKYPIVQLRYYQVDKDPVAAERLLELFKNSGQWPPSVPAFAHNGRMVVGFEGPEETAYELVRMLRLEKEVIQKRQTSNINHALFGVLDIQKLGLPLFTFTIGLLDGLNPCAMWVLLFLLSMLVHFKSRSRMLIIAGSFVFVSGLVYYAFMAAWLNLFLFVGLSARITYALAIIALIIGFININDYFTPARGISLKIPELAKPGIYAQVRNIVQSKNLFFALTAAIILAVAVNLIELLCTAGLPALYTAILSQMELSPISYYAYLGLYIIGYMADDAFMVFLAVLALGSRKMSANSGRYLKLLSGVVMILLGLIMTIKPEWLY